MSLHVVPIELREANDFIAAMHRHHAPVIGHRFSIGAVDECGLLRGVCVVGRPVARLAGHPREVAEVTRLATDGTYNACSILYAAAARACKAMGFRRIQTYTLPSEGGASLRASGWVCEGEAGGGSMETHGRQAPAHRSADRGEVEVGTHVHEAGICGGCHARGRDRARRSGGAAMNHDPLCPNQNDPDPKCHACHLIDMARQEERRTVLDAAREAVEGAFIVDSNGSPEPGHSWNAAIGVAVEYLALLDDQTALETA